MNAVIRPWKKLLGVFPSQLPRAKSAFDAYCTSLFDVYELPSTPGYVQAIATMIMHLNPEQDRFPKRRLAKAIRKAMSNEIAYQVIHEAREKSKQEQSKTPLEVVADEKEVSH